MRGCFAPRLAKTKTPPGRVRFSFSVGPVGLEPTTHGLKERGIRQSPLGLLFLAFKIPMFSRNYKCLQMQIAANFKGGIKGLGSLALFLSKNV